MNRIIKGHLNINSLRNKFESLQEQINWNVDILLISETKLDNSFPNGQFLIKWYSTPYRLDWDAKGGKDVIYKRKYPFKTLAVENFPFKLKGFYVEINLRKKKWLLCCSYNPKKNNIRAHLDCLNKSLALHLLKYEHFLVIDFKVWVEDSSLSEFCDT